MAIEINGIGTPKQVQKKVADEQLTSGHATGSHAAIIIETIIIIIVIIIMIII